MFDTNYIEFTDYGIFYEVLEWEEDAYYMAHLIEISTVTLGIDSYKDQFTLLVL